ncbi:MAG TPA: hypothetical protein VHX15_16510 [Frankiaceae bacterium]|jgi:hypothetical protein|nr:hypothetical protein [Frankiaceae bacterium]
MMLALIHRPPSRLGDHLLLAAALAVLVLIVIALAMAAVRRRARQTAAVLPELPAPPRPFPIPLIEPMPGVALGTTMEAGWQDVRLGGVLGGRGSGDLSITCVGVDLAGTWLPAQVLRSVRIDERFATKFMPGTGLLVFGWEASGIQYESGFRGAASRYEEVVATVQGLLERTRELEREAAAAPTREAHQ